MPTYLHRNFEADSSGKNRIVFPNNGICLDLGEFPVLERDDLIVVTCNETDAYGSVFEFARPKGLPADWSTLPEKEAQDLLAAECNDDNWVADVNHGEGFVLGLGGPGDEGFWIAVNHILSMSLDHDGTRFSEDY